MTAKYDDFVWSWSRVNSFDLALKQDSCLYSWYRSYIEEDRGKGNWFGEIGTLTHEISERMFKKELFEWDLEDEVNQRLNNMEFTAPFRTMDVSYRKGIKQFFDDFEEQFKKYKVLAIEDEVFFNVNGNKWRGFIDMVCEHEDYGLCIADLKTAKVYSGEKLQNNIGQMYLYSIAVKAKYGRYPDNLLFIYPREEHGSREYPYKFDLKKLEETKKHVTDTIEKIKIHSDWSPSCVDAKSAESFFARFLCNHRDSCHYKDKAKNEIVNPFNEE